MAALNYRGIAESIKVNIGITIIEASGLIFIILIGVWVLIKGDGDPGARSGVRESDTSRNSRQLETTSERRLFQTPNR